ncbi:hypothetical protein ACFV98_36575 [Streptomyces violascens]|uniref:hypothetical protein n=1 Tax=Streptomyces violascens TaxID=67381 RepID=UPI0036489AF9
MYRVDAGPQCAGVGEVADEGADRETSFLLAVDHGHRLVVARSPIESRTSRRRSGASATRR